MTRAALAHVHAVAVEARQVTPKQQLRYGKAEFASVVELKNEHAEATPARSGAMAGARLIEQVAVAPGSWKNLARGGEHGSR